MQGVAHADVHCECNHDKGVLSPNDACDESSKVVRENLRINYPKICAFKLEEIATFDSRSKLLDTISTGEIEESVANALSDVAELLGISANSIVSWPLKHRTSSSELCTKISFFLNGEVMDFSPERNTCCQNGKC